MISRVRTFDVLGGTYGGFLIKTSLSSQLVLSLSMEGIDLTVEALEKLENGDFITGQFSFILKCTRKLNFEWNRPQKLENWSTGSKVTFNFLIG